MKICEKYNKCLIRDNKFHLVGEINITIGELTEHLGVPAVSSRVDSFPLSAEVPEAVESTQCGVPPEHAEPVDPQTHAPEVHLLWVDSVQLDVEH